MDHELVETFRKKLDSLAISDYHGLRSPGLTCYLNCVLQLLFMTEDFRASIKQGGSDDPTTIDALLKRLFDNLERSLARTHRLTKVLGIVDVYKQRDAAEYFEKILCLTSPEASKVFKGELIHQITCVCCKNTNDSPGNFWVLPLAMETSSRQTFSVVQGLKAFFRKETVSGDNRMFCTQCDRKQDAVIACEMKQNPKILTLLLKRFAFDSTCREYVKLHCEVEVPRTLHIQDCQYELYALVHHIGNLMGGHYTAVIKSFETGQWYLFDDNVVEMVKHSLFGSGNSLRSYTVYLLLYKKVSPHLEESDGVDQDVEYEAEGGDGPDPHQAPRHERCSGGENGTFFGSGNLEQQPDQGELWVRRHRDDDGHMLLRQVSHFSNSLSEREQPGNERKRKKHRETSSKPPWR